ncbi:hypothetical protein ANCCAN_23721 [Ancylostoma caninum]|uniref:Uncharacterized protein n=1 Tax=Ancylostoma caninum TaxID=29170 RepID=A0A368FE79_ANCCA|nr:hypothetical protein ANCCAN_23721 [Ancylostoma caninum]
MGFEMAHNTCRKEENLWARELGHSNLVVSFSKAASKSGAPQLAATATDTSYDGSKPDESQRKQHMLDKVKASYGRQADNPLFSNSLPVLLNSTVRGAQRWVNLPNGTGEFEFQQVSPLPTSNATNFVTSEMFAAPPLARPRKLHKLND